uniref:Rad4 beta-hairpin domain-containing protein n=2 Tax=Strongyloides stercoralis TaxID=6248 RepID=A0AAF5DR38_STRER
FEMKPQQSLEDSVEVDYSVETSELPNINHLQDIHKTVVNDEERLSFVVEDKDNHNDNLKLIEQISNTRKRSLLDDSHVETDKRIEHYTQENNKENIGNLQVKDKGESLNIKEVSNKICSKKMEKAIRIKKRPNPDDILLMPVKKVKVEKGKEIETLSDEMDKEDIGKSQLTVDEESSNTGDSNIRCHLERMEKITYYREQSSPNRISSTSIKETEEEKTNTNKLLRKKKEELEVFYSFIGLNMININCRVCSPCKPSSHLRKAKKSKSEARKVKEWTPIDIITRDFKILNEEAFRGPNIFYILSIGFNDMFENVTERYTKSLIFNKYKRSEMLNGVLSEITKIYNGGELKNTYSDDPENISFLKHLQKQDFQENISDFKNDKLYTPEQLFEKGRVIKKNEKPLKYIFETFKSEDYADLSNSFTKPLYGKWQTKKRDSGFS